MQSGPASAEWMTRLSSILSAVPATMPGVDEGTCLAWDDKKTLPDV